MFKPFVIGARFLAYIQYRGQNLSSFSPSSGGGLIKPYSSVRFVFERYIKMPPKAVKSEAGGEDKKEHSLSDSGSDNETKNEAKKSKVNKTQQKKAQEKKPTTSKGNSKKRTADGEDTPNKKAKLEVEKPNLEDLNFECDKQSSRGRIFNLKITTWNVAGLRAWLKKDGIKYVRKEDPDMLCLQETKCPTSKVPPEAKLPDYHMYWANSVKDGYAGVALYSKKKPNKVDYGLGIKEFDDEGRVITAEYDEFYLVSTYVPNAGQGLKTLPKRMKWDIEFRSHLKKLNSKKPVILCGDLNVAHNPIDLANPASNAKHAGFTKEERDGFTQLLKEVKFTDVFRHLYPDKTGAYTFWTFLGNARARNAGWRLDYFVLSKKLLPSICDVVIRDKVYGSDHCPVTLFLDIPH